MTSIFTKIIQREIPADIIYEQEDIIVIRDIQPQAKTHLLIIPKKEIPTINDISLEDNVVLWNMFQVAKKVAANLGISEGYKLHINVWEKWGQEVMHIHMHVLSDIEV